MKKHAVSYAIIRFQPHVETEEFANIGIVLVAPRISYLDFRLETRRLGRLTSFFDSVEATTIRSVLKSYNLELKRIRDLAGHNGSGQSRFEFELSDNAEHLFHALTKDREGVIRFSEIRFAMTDSPKAKLDELFDYYVRQNFAGSVYREGLLEKHVRGILKLRDIGRNLKPMEFTDGLYSAKFPFVEIVQDKPRKVLKPIYLGQDEPSRILEHGNKWLFTINRLKEKMPPDVVVAVEGPKDSAKRRQAFHEAVEQFRVNNIKVVDGRNENELIGAMER
ncbi:DUF3037 domain-containing protein [Martelella mediterranea]|uniref:DUF3037 domain-containing protein n=1 Tax=Martelella mediterranea DSM 17316 TaxID=1122214 RepID=A0A1U9Z0A8_9HYPH|nr:DUF3037 domain-containing protein [Martelella mediterranea]AQZ51114.1 hypothetical protein Mame_01769 [Martelella mediterranea DSM 17316]